MPKRLETSHDMFAADNVVPAKGGIGPGGPGKRPDEWMLSQGWTKNEKGEWVPPVPPNLTEEQAKQQAEEAEKRRQRGYNPGALRPRQPRTEDTSKGTGLEDLPTRPADEKTIRQLIEKAYVNLESLDSQEKYLRQTVLQSGDRAQNMIAEQQLEQIQAQRQKIESDLAALNKMLTQQTRPEQYSEMEQRQKAEQAAQQQRVRRDLVSNEIWQTLSPIRGINETQGKLIPAEERVIIGMLSEAPTAIEDEAKWEQFMKDLVDVVDKNRKNALQNQKPVYVSNKVLAYERTEWRNPKKVDLPGEIKKRFGLTDEEASSIFNGTPSNLRSALQNRYLYDPIRKIDDRIAEIKEKSPGTVEGQQAVKQLSTYREEILQAENQWIQENVKSGINWTPDLGEFRVWDKRDKDNPNRTRFDDKIEEVYNALFPKTEPQKPQNFKNLDLTSVEEPISRGLVQAIQKLVKKYPEISIDPASGFYRQQEGVNPAGLAEREETLRRVREMRQRGLMSDDLTAVKEISPDGTEQSEGQAPTAEGGTTEQEEAEQMVLEGLEAPLYEFDDSDLTQAEYSQALDILEEQAAKTVKEPRKKKSPKMDAVGQPNAPKPESISYQDVVKDLIASAEYSNNYDYFATDEQGNVLKTQDGEPVLNTQGRAMARGIWETNLEDMVAHLLYSNPTIQASLRSALFRMNPKALNSSDQIDGLRNLVYTDVVDAIKEKKPYSLTVRWPFIQQDASERRLELEDGVARWLNSQVWGSVKRLNEGMRRYYTSEYRKYVTKKDKAFAEIKSMYPPVEGDDKKTKENALAASKARGDWMRENPFRGDRYTTLSPLEQLLEQTPLDEALERAEYNSGDFVSEPQAPQEVSDDDFDAIKQNVEQHVKDKRALQLMEILQQNPQFLTVVPQTAEEVTAWNSERQAFIAGPAFKKALDEKMAQWTTANPQPKETGQKKQWKDLYERHAKNVRLNIVEDWADSNPKPNPAKYSNVSVGKGRWKDILAKWNEMFPDDQLNASASLEKAWTALSKLFVIETPEDKKPKAEQPKAPEVLEDTSSPIQPSEQAEAETADFADLLKRSKMLRLAKVRSLLKKRSKNERKR